MSKILRNIILALVLSFGAASAFSTFIDVPVAEAAGKKKGKKPVKKAKKGKKGKKATAWKHCGTYMYHDKKGKCVDARSVVKK
jgi:hypothetical protein